MNEHDSICIHRRGEGLVFIVCSLGFGYWVVVVGVGCWARFGLIGVIFKKHVNPVVAFTTHDGRT